MRRRFREARRLSEDGRAAYEELGRPVSLATAWAPVAAEVELLAGDLDAAEEILRDSCAYLAGADERSSLATQAGQLAHVLFAGRSIKDAERWAAVSETCAASDDLSAQLAWRGARAKVLARRGVLPDAEELAREAVRLADATDALNDRAAVLLDLGEVLRLGTREAEACRSVEDAIALYERKGNRAGAMKAKAFLRDLAPA